MKPSLAFTAAILFLLVPSIAMAAVGDVFGLATWVYAFLGRVGMLFWALAIMLFIWGVVKFIGNTEDTTERTKGKQFIIWGIVSFVVLVSLWGIVQFILLGTFDITPGGQTPYIQDT